MTQLRTRTRDEAGVARRTSWFLPVANGVALATFLGIALAVQPPIDPAAPVDSATMFISLALWCSVFAAAFALVAGRRWGFVASGLAGVLLVSAAANCFAGGHTGTWLITQGLGGAGLATTGAISWKVSA